MRVRRFQFSIRALLLFLVVVACIVALMRSYGRHLLWVPCHFIAGHVSLNEVKAPSPKPDESFVRCQVGWIAFALPESMTKQISIARTGNDIWVNFADPNRQVGVQFPQHEANNTNSLRPTLLPIPDGAADWSTPRLMKEVCDCSSGDFSLTQSNADLQRHQWAITQRRKQLLDDNNYTHYSFEADRTCQWILLSCNPAAVDRKERLRSIFVWEMMDSNASGQIHFGDVARQEVAWIGALARSFRVLLPPTERQAIDVASKTDSEIMSMIRLDRDVRESD